MSVRTLTSANFDAEVLQSKLPVLVDFHATWCGPCKKLGPIVEKLAADLSGRVKVCKLDIDEAKDIKNRYGIRTVPTVMMFKNGQRVGTQVGLATREQLTKLLGV